MMRSVLRSLALTPLMVVQSCYTYAPIEPSGARPGTAVRARVHATAGERLATLVPTSDRRLISGTLIENGPAGMLLEVPTIIPADAGTSLQALHQRVSIARSDLIELEARQLDRLRTGAFAGGIALLAGSVAITAFKGTGSSERVPGGGTTDIRLMLLRVVR